MELTATGAMTGSQQACEVIPRQDHRGVNLISDLLPVVGVVHRFLSCCHAGKELLLGRRIGCVESRLLVHPINRVLKTPIGRGIRGRARF
jgi:hypothetical protein